jgi:hypothetical protein
VWWEKTSRARPSSFEFPASSTHALRRRNAKRDERTKSGLRSERTADCEIDAGATAMETSVIKTVECAAAILGATFLSIVAAKAEGISINLTYDSVMDMIKPEPHPGISVHHNLQIQMNGGKLTENRDRSTGKYFDKNSTVQEHGSEGGGGVVWHVTDQNHLMRVQTFSQSTRKMIVTLNSDKTCSLSVVDELKPGYQEYAFLRISTHSIGYFSSYHVVGTSCTIQ